MKRFLLFVLSLGLLFSLTSCGSLFGWHASDEAAISQMEFEPLEWKDEYVITKVCNPYGFQVWDTKSDGFVRFYDFGSLWPMDYTVVDDNTVFATVLGNTQSLIRFDLRTGKVKYLGVAKMVDCLICVETSDDTKYVWEIFYPISSGLQLKKYDTQGNLLDILWLDNGNIRWEFLFAYNEETYLVATHDPPFNVDKLNEEYLWLVNLNKREMQKIPILPFLKEGFIKDNIPCGTSEIDLFFGLREFFEKKYLMISLYSDTVNSDTVNRKLGTWYFDIESFVPLKVGECNIELSNLNGSILCESENTFYLLHETGSESGIFSLYDRIKEKTKRQYCLMNYDYVIRNIPGKLFFSRNTWTFDNSTNKWDKSGQPSIYVYNMQTEKMHIVYADGTREEVQPEGK